MRTSSLLHAPLARLAALTVAIGALAGCETIGGLGEDIEQGGETLSGAAEQSEDEIQDEL